MKSIYEKIKNQFTDIDKEDVLRIGKWIGAGLVVFTMCIVCIVSYVSSKNDKNAAVGIMMTMSDVASRKEPFSGNRFDVAAISYSGMINSAYETEQMAQLEKTEKEIEEILSARKHEKRGLATNSAINSRKQAAVQIAEYDPDAVRPADDPNIVRPKPTITTTTTTSTGKDNSKAQYTFADDKATYELIGNFELTAYCACSICCDQYADGITYTGTVATQGRTIAVDPSVIPLGSEVRIGDNIYIAEDIGGAIQRNRIDVFFSSHQDALVFGRRFNVPVYLVKRK